MVRRQRRRRRRRRRRADKATSENLPVGTEDIAANLDIADKIKSKEVAARAAVQTLKRRINHRNPNVQLMALKLTDTCVKNSGSHFLVEVASREFIDNLVSLGRSLTANAEVKSKTLGLIQSWGIAFKSRPELSYVSEIYETLKRDGANFPPVESAASAAAIIDTKTAPEWTDSEICMRCRTAFTTFNRKHHCRNCGQTFCNDCSSKRLPLPLLGVTEAVRVCDSCHTKLTSKSASAGGDRVSVSATSGSSSSSNGTTRAQELARKEEDDLAKAIAASLALESGGRSSSSTASSTPAKAPVKQQSSVRFRDERSPSPPAASAGHGDDSDDEDLKRAIAESLRSSQATQPTRQPTSSVSYGSTAMNATSAAAPAAAPAARATVTASTTATAPEISATELETIRLFSELVERLEADAAAAGMGASTLNPTQLAAFYGQVAPMAGKLHAGLEQAAARYRGLYDMNEGINEAVRAYDALLKARVDLAAQRAGGGAPYYGAVGVAQGQPQPQPQPWGAQGQVQVQPQPYSYGVQPGHHEAAVQPQQPQPQPQYAYGPPAGYAPQQPPYGQQPGVPVYASQPYAQQPLPQQQQQQQPLQQQPVYGQPPVQHQQAPPPQPVVQEAPLIEL
ncbi:hypothetical protein BC831DRAFT_401583 [Entophlyctis helioformis]|nr:hypothetical protein BC831DRAFT_401583 [Entophlyctis helioformis]